MKKKTKTIIGVVVVCVLLIAIFSSIAVFAKNDTTKISSLEFSRGGLDATTGEYVETDQSIYTEDAFACYGLRIEPDFEATVTYDIYYYDENDVLMKKVTGLSDVYDEDFEIAAKARIVIHPDIPEDADMDDWKVGRLEVNKYARMLKITVAKTPERDIDYTSLWNGETGVADSGIDDDIFTPSPSEANRNYLLSNVIELEKSYDGLIVALKVEYPPEAYPTIYLADEDGALLRSVSTTSAKVNADGWLVFEIEEELTENAVYARVKIHSTSTDTVYVFGYND